MRKNKRFLILAGGMLLVMAMALLGMNLTLRRARVQLRQEYYREAASLLDAVREQFPEFEERGWIESLNRDQTGEEGSRVLAQYGFLEDEASFLTLEKQMNRYALRVNLLLLFCFALLLLFWGISGLHKRKRIGELTQCLRQIEHGDYSLDVLDNSEDEFSLLKSELRKVTVLLSEAASRERAGKKALSDAVSDISHQLKTPLTSCMILLDNLSQSEHMEEHTRTHFLNEVTGQLLHVNWLVATLLKLSRLDAGVVEFERKQFQLEELLDEIAESLEILAEWKNVQIRREGDCGIVLEGDRLWMKEALLNLVKNGIEHSPEKGEVILRAQENDVYVLLEICDSGEGLDEEEQKHVFERFYRSPGADASHVGIGLSLAREILLHQNGVLSVSSAKGEGCVFRIKFLKV